MPNVGDVVGIKTKNVIGKESAFKWHLCICSPDRRYLFVCSRQYYGDFPIANRQCPGLENETSYISLSRLIHVPDVLMRSAKRACCVGDSFLRQLWNHVMGADVLSEIDRKKIINGLRLHFEK
jgi:hypothetical protein